MNLPIITADQRLAERRGVKGVLVGKSGIGQDREIGFARKVFDAVFGTTTKSGAVGADDVGGCHGVTPVRA